MVNVFEEYAYDKGTLSVSDLNFFEEMTQEDTGEFHQRSEDRRLIIRQLLAEVSRHRSDYTWEW